VLEERQAEIEARTAELIAARERIDDLERVATRLSEGVVERERELRRVRRELARVREEGDEGLRSLTKLAEELHQVRAQARGQATRMRLRALRDAAEISERVSELARRPTSMREKVVDSIAEAIKRIGGDEEEEIEVEEEPLRAVGEYNGHEEREPAELFEGLVEVEIGPLTDFSQLVLFEDAAKSITAMSEISVQRFTGGRATLEMNLREPVALLRELEERCDLEFRVRDMRRDRLILDVDDDEQAAA
jgi:hypothetical protein